MTHSIVDGLALLMDGNGPSEHPCGIFKVDASNIILLVPPSPSGTSDRIVASNCRAEPSMMQCVMLAKLMHMWLSRLHNQTLFLFAALVMGRLRGHETYSLT